MMSNNFSQNKNLKTVWRNIAVAVFAVCFALLGLCVTVIPTHAADDDTFITIGEIYNNPANMQKLYDALRGATAGTTYAQIADLAEQKQNAQNFRELNNGQDIKVTFGGREWHVCYLSTTKDDKPILTLWAAEVLNDETYTWVKIFHTNGCAYGLSYVRAVLLNNGGTYFDSTGGDDDKLTVNPVAEHALAAFTYGDTPWQKVIVQPRQVAWQEHQDARDYGHDYKQHNEEYATSLDSEWPTYTVPDPDPDPDSAAGGAILTVGGTNLTAVDGFDAWQDDNLWLPSWSEARSGQFWQLSAQQLAVERPSWLRSVNNAYNGGGTYANAFVVNEYDGLEIFKEGNRAHFQVFGLEGKFYVRPALHIDLSAPELAANLDEVPDSLGEVVYDGDEHRVETANPAWYREGMQITYTNQKGENVTEIKNAGEYTAEITLGQLTKTTTFTITPRAVTWTGTLTPQDRVYNRDRTIDLNKSVRLDPAVDGDDVDVTFSAVCADKNVGNKKPVTVTAELTGKDKGNYVLTNPVNTTDYTVVITQKTIVVDGIAVESKVYDNTTRANFTTSGVNLLLGGMLAGDDLTVAVSGNYATSDVGNDLPVTMNLTLVGDDAANYKIDLPNSQQEARGNITQRLITVAINNQTVKVGDPLKALTARVISGSLVDPADAVYELSIESTAPEIDVDNLPVGEYVITGKSINNNYYLDFVDGKYTVLTAEAWDALQTTDEAKDGNNAWLIIVIVIAIAAFIGALVGIGLVVRSHDKHREPKPAKEPKPKKDKKAKTDASTAPDAK